MIENSQTNTENQKSKITQKNTIKPVLQNRQKSNVKSSKFASHIKSTICIVKSPKAWSDVYRKLVAEVCLCFVFHYNVCDLKWHLWRFSSNIQPENKTDWNHQNYHEHNKQKYDKHISKLHKVMTIIIVKINHKNKKKITKSVSITAYIEAKYHCRDLCNVCADYSTKVDWFIISCIIFALFISNLLQIGLKINAQWLSESLFLKWAWTL